MPAGGATAFGGTPLQKAYIVGATFTAGMSQYDQAYIFMPLEQAQLFFGREDTVDAIEVRVHDPDQAERLKTPISRARTRCTGSPMPGRSRSRRQARARSMRVSRSVFRVT